MITNDEVFDAMADQQRRELLVGLLHEDPQPVPQLSGVAREILGAHDTVLSEYLSDVQEIADAKKTDIRTHHVHLPKLVTYNYIEWNRETGLVTKGADFDDVRPLAEFVEGHDTDHPIHNGKVAISK